jgi:serine/threonine-protein kinase
MSDTIEAYCPSCKHPFSASDNDIGRVTTCDSCGDECIVPSNRIQAGSMFGRFRILQPLGVGGTGEVHLAADPEADDLELALKIMFVDDVEPNDVRRFQREAAHAQQLVHPAIVTIFESGCVGHHYYLAMEYVEGQTLDEVLAEQGPLGERQALAMARTVADAMAHAWDEYQLLHRDIKPGNIIIDYFNQARVMDFGIARSLLEHTRLTDERTIIGTPHYMSPEQCAPSKPIDTRADMYSLGATLYHVLTGEFAFSAPQPLEIVRMQMFSRLPDPRERRPEISAECAALITRMMSKSAMDRHECWAEVIREIDTMLAG